MQEQELVNAIAKLVVEQLKNVDVCDPKDRIPVGISARHVHLSQADLETLFGKGYELHKKKDLMGGAVCGAGVCDHHWNKAPCHRE